MIASPVPAWSRKRINLEEETGTGSSAKKARQDLHPHVSTDAAPADLKNGSDDGDSRAGSTEDSIEVSTHVDAINFSDSNYDHGLGQHNAAKQYLGLIAPAGHGARRACVNRAAPSGWQWAPRRPGGAHGVHSKKRVPHRWSSHCKTWSAFETLLAPDFQ